MNIDFKYSVELCKEFTPFLLVLQIDFASRDCQNAFFDNMERTGQINPTERPDDMGNFAHPTGPPMPFDR